MALMRFCAASIALAAALLSLAGCGNNVVNPAPDRLSTEAAVPIPPSQVIIPATISLSDLERRINAELPAKLYTIDKVEKACLPAQRVLGLKVTPNVGCRIVGAVTRGHIRVFGRGETLFLTMPVSATVSAKNIGGIIKSETATGGGEVRAKVRLDVSRDWQPQARLLIDYDWTRKPGVTVLGHRFTFAHQADEKLAKVISRLERDIPKHLLALNPKAKIEKAWASGFTTILVNRANPPVWLRLTPEQLGYGGYRVTQDKLLLNLALTAKLETFVGDRPADPAKVPLPPAQTFTDKGGFQLQVPVIASYEQLEPVLDKALSKVASRGIAVPEIGDIRVKFGKSTIYATTNGRLAVGLAVSAKTGRWPFATKGKVWLTGIAYNEPGSQRVMVRDLTVQGTSDDRAGRLLLAIANSDQVEAALSHAVKLDFANDLEKLIAKIRSALAEKRIGDFVVNTRIEKFEHGPITPVAQGLYMPVSVSGVATVSVQSDKGNSPAIRK